MTETPDQLAALDRAATQGVWEAHLIDGTAYMVSRPNSASTIQAETVDDLRLAATLVNAYRAKQLVLIGPDAAEALRANKQGWENAVEMGLLPPRHHDTARALIEQTAAAIAAWGVK
jgi:hypothetical protein